MAQITECAGYRSLLRSVERDEARDSSRGKPFHDYRGKLAWVIERAQHYAEKTGCDAAAILDAWEGRRDYWYMNYYQDSNQPRIEGDSVRVFETLEDARASIAKAGFRCPACEGVSSDPYECDASEKCDWKAYGLFGTLGKGAYLFIKADMRIGEIFTPVAWEGR